MLRETLYIKSRKCVFSKTLFFILVDAQDNYPVFLKLFSLLFVSSDEKALVVYCRFDACMKASVI